MLKNNTMVMPIQIEYLILNKFKMSTIESAWYVLLNGSNLISVVLNLKFDSYESKLT